MIFWLRKPVDASEEEQDFIFLDQLLKAMRVMEDYPTIREAIHQGKVKVNGVVTHSRRKMIYENDEVTYEKEFIKVYGKERAIKKAKIKKQEEQGTVENVRHGKGMMKWIEKPLDNKRKKKS